MKLHRWVGRARYGVMLLVAGLTVVAACSAGPGTEGTAGGHRDTAVRTTRGSSASRAANPDAASAVVAAPAATGDVAVPAASGALGTAPSSGPVPQPAPVAAAEVTIAAVSDGSFGAHDDHECSNAKSSYIERGELTVSRTGSSDAALTVRYAVGGDTADVAPSSGEVTIPAGASSASILVDPSSVIPPTPAHVHRTGTVTFTLLDGPDYDLGGAASANVGVHFDIDEFGCPTPVLPGSAPGQTVES